MKKEENDERELSRKMLINTLTDLENYRDLVLLMRERIAKLEAKISNQEQIIVRLIEEQENDGVNTKREAIEWLSEDYQEKYLN